MPPALIHLPRQFDGQSMTQIVTHLNGAAHGGKLPPEICFNFSTLNFIRPAGVTFLNNLVGWLHVQKVKVTFAGMNLYSAPIAYLDDSLFFERHLGHKLVASSRPRSTTVPLQQVSQAESHMWLRTTLIPWLAGSLSVPEASLQQFQVCISELFNNISDHTRFDIGCIFVQHFPREDRVLISVADFGRGIPDSVRQVRQEISDVDAVLQAVEEGFTSKSTPRNRGAGLDYLLRTVALGNAGVVTIFSGSAIVKFYERSGEIVSEVVASVGFSPGTLIEIELRTDTIESVEDDSEEFEW